MTVCTSELLVASVVCMSSAQQLGVLGSRPVTDQTECLSPADRGIYILHVCVCVYLYVCIFLLVGLHPAQRREQDEAVSAVCVRMSAV